MGILQDCAAAATLPAADIERAKAWYKDKLGLTPKEEDPGGVMYETGGTRWAIFPTPHAGTATNTAMGWRVPDVKAAVDELKSSGVTFETFDAEGIEWDGEVATMGGYRGAWFKDSEGNTLALEESTPA